MTASEELTNRGLEALRQEEQAAPDSFVSTMLSRPKPTGLRRALVRLALASMCVLAVATVAFWPQPSTAAGLQDVIQASKGNQFRIERHYELQPDGKRKILMEATIEGTKWHVRDGHTGRETAFDGFRMTHYFGRDSYVMVESRRIAPQDSAWQPASLERLLSFDQIKKVVKETAIQWRGKSVDRYTVEAEIIDAQGKLLHSKSVIYADTRSDRPLYVELTMDGLPPMVIEYEYPAPRPSALSIAIPKGTPVFDLDEQRKSLDAWMKQDLGTQKVGRLSITLRAVFVDETAQVTAIYTGGRGRRTGDRVGLRVDGLATHEFSSPAVFMKSESSGRSSVAFPYPYQGQGLLGESTSFAQGTRFPRNFKLEIPIWDEDDEGQWKHVGYAAFHVRNPIRTMGINMLLAPNNLPIFWDKTERKNGPTTATQR